MLMCSTRVMTAAMHTDVIAPPFAVLFRLLCCLVGNDPDPCVDNIINWSCPLRSMISIDAMSFSASMVRCGAMRILKCVFCAPGVAHPPLWPHGRRTAFALAPTVAYLAGVLYLFL